MKRKNLIIGALIMLAMLVSGFTYAYWAASVTGNNDTATGTVQIGVGETYTTTVTVGDQTGGILVPSGYADDSGETESVELTFPVSWDGDAAIDGMTGSLVVTIGDVLVGGVENPYGLINVAFTANYSIIANGSDVEVLVTITMNEPADQTEYAAVANKNITFTLTFTVTPNA
jgi:predicted ribosomally synthesized peptide with SipW-like signal peptide